MGDGGYRWMPKEYVTEPRDGLTVSVVRDAWWAVNSEGEVLFYHGHRGYGSPQMNRDRNIADRLLRSTYGVTDVIKIPLAFYPVDMRDY